MMQQLLRPTKTRRVDHTSYWHDVLAGVSTKLELPTDRPRPSVQSLRQSTLALKLPHALIQKLQALADQEQATLHIILGAGFLALLQRYTGQDDILVGSPVLRRAHRDSNLSVLNTVVLRARFTDHIPFRSFLRQVREGTLGAFAHVETPFETGSSRRSHEGARRTDGCG